MRYVAGMKLLAVLMIWLAAAGAARADWVQITGDDAITAALAEVEILYDSGASQRFHASGRTFYDDARPSWGYWRAEGGQYCSQWPPSDHWACYDLFTDGTGALRFAGSAGDAYIGRPVAP